ncbi:MBL fold metallo-hydrolase [Thermodesulfobacteriota bacterium]
MIKPIITAALLSGSMLMAQQCSFQDYQGTEGFDKIAHSKNYKDGKFQNSTPTRMMAKGKFWTMVKKYITGGQKPRRPSNTLPVVPLTGGDFSNPTSEDLRLVWLGHSSVLVEFEGKRYLIDPMFSERASFVQWAGPKRFQPAPLIAENVPELDGIIISHDHYDHLDRGTIEHFTNGKVPFYVPLGVGKYLVSWGIDSSRIVECDWWDEVTDDKVKLIATPARHFSGRGLFDRDETLWCSWVLAGEKSRIYFSGDNGLSPAFEEIGRDYGPFDITFLEIGAYDETWPEIHLNPEEAVQAQIMLKGKRLIPIHWGTFDLGLHNWYDPVERLVQAAKSNNIVYSLPRQGEVISLTHLEKDTDWWKEERLKEDHPDD